MKTYSILLQDATREQHIDEVCAFVGEDASGSFSIWAGHENMMTVLNMGLARIRLNTQSWQYLAVPGALLYFRDNTLTLSTRRYFLGNDYAQIVASLREQLLTEEKNLQNIKTSFRRMEDETLKRLYELNLQRDVYYA